VKYTIIQAPEIRNYTSARNTQLHKRQKYSTIENNRKI